MTPLKKYFVLAVLAVGPAASSLEARDFDRGIRKIERYARRAARQADRLARESARTNAAECPAAAARADGRRPEPPLARCGCTERPASKEFFCRPEPRTRDRKHDRTRTVRISKDECLYRTLSELPASTRRKIRRVLKELPQSVQETSAVRTTQDALKHPRRYRPAGDTDTGR